MNLPYMNFFRNLIDTFLHYIRFFHFSFHDNLFVPSRSHPALFIFTKRAMRITDDDYCYLCRVKTELLCPC